MQARAGSARDVAHDVDLQRLLLGHHAEFLWGQASITSALANLQGQYFVNQNLLAAGALITAVPTLVVYILLQKQFISGLSLGSSKG